MTTNQQWPLAECFVASTHAGLYLTEADILAVRRTELCLSNGTYPRAFGDEHSLQVLLSSIACAGTVCVEEANITELEPPVSNGERIEGLWQDRDFWHANIFSEQDKIDALVGATEVGGAVSGIPKSIIAKRIAALSAPSSAGSGLWTYTESAGRSSSKRGDCTVVAGANHHAALSRLEEYAGTKSLGLWRWIDFVSGVSPDEVSVRHIATSGWTAIQNPSAELEG